jgi:hypothetical protein
MTASASTADPLAFKMKVESIEQARFHYPQSARYIAPFIDLRRSRFTYL